MAEKFFGPDDKVISINYLLVLVNLVDDLIGEGQTVLEDTDVSDNTLQDPASYINYKQFKTAIENAVNITGKPELGLYYGQRLNFTAHGEVGIAMLSSENLQDAISIGAKYIVVNNPMLDINYDLDEELGITKIGLHLKLATLISKRFLSDAVMASIHSMRLFLLGNNASSCEIHFEHQVNNEIAIYDKIFANTLHFNYPSTEYCFAATELTAKLPLADPLMREAAELQCKQKLKNLVGSDDLISKIEKLLLQASCDGKGNFPSLDEVAANLFMSSRTLKRKLQQLDTSYQLILNKIREELACDYLQTSSLTIQQISEILGYSDASNFANAFCKWTGKKPGEYRSAT